MKKIILTAVAAMMMTISFAETTNTSAVKNVEESGLTFDLRRLAVTLDLTDNQMEAVKVISDNFNDELISAQRQAVQYIHAAAGSHTSEPLHLVMKGKKDCLPAASEFPERPLNFLKTMNFEL